MYQIILLLMMIGIILINPQEYAMYFFDNSAFLFESERKDLLFQDHLSFLKRTV